MKQTPISPQAAEELAIRALLFLSAESDRLERFVALSGMTVETLRENAQDRAILAGVLEYILSDDSLVLGLAADANVAPEIPALAYRALGGHSDF